MAKDTASGKMPDNGLTEKSSFAGDSTSSLALDSKGSDQKPIGTVKKGISTSRGKFELR